jgi:hypothetical protein
MTNPELLARLPVRVDRRTGAAIVTQFFFPVSRRTLESWQLPTAHANGRALIETKDLIEAAEAKLGTGLGLRGGRLRGRCAVKRATAPAESS